MILLKTIIALIFGIQALGKFNGMNAETYERWGLTDGKLFLLGVLEILAAIGLFFPFAYIANIFLLAIMCGAFFIIIRHKEPLKSYEMPIITTGLLVIALFYEIKNNLIIS